MGRLSSLQRIITLALISILSYHGEANGAISRSAGTSTKQHDLEDLELEAQLKILNKPPVKTILQRDGGGVFDCVDIYKQPAFDNPLLKNHKIQLRPSNLVPRSSAHKASSIRGPDSSSDVLQRMDCPDGTVPIRRTSKEDLIRAKSFSPASYNSTTNSATWGIIGANIISKANLPEGFVGARGDFSLNDPTVTSDDQYTGSFVWMAGGPYEANEFVQAGWAVAPPLYDDKKPHLTVAWQSGSAGCFNVLCSGFVQIDQQYAVGAPAGPLSVYGGVQYELLFSIYKDAFTGNWWLQTVDSIKIGYWPKSLFTHLSAAGGANIVAWGGQVQFKAGAPCPPMGNGHFPDHQYDKASSVLRLSVLHDFRAWTFDESEYAAATGSESCYKVEFDGFVRAVQGYSFLYGGPGGSTCS